MLSNFSKRNLEVNSLEDFFKDRDLTEKKDLFIKNMKEAVAFYQANKHLPITIVGDYDCDGVTSTTILEKGLIADGVIPKIRIPLRFSEGYGLSEKIIDEIQEGLVITVDNGIAAIGAIEKAKEKGLKVIILDHHLPIRDAEGNVVLPPADVVVDAAAEEESEFHNYCGAGIAYRFIKEIIPKKARILQELIILAGIGTVADVMPIISENKYLVKESLRLINQGKGTLGIRTLVKTMNMEHLVADDYGFRIGPIVNASSRLYDDGAKQVETALAAPDNCATIKWKVKKLIDTNDKRKEITKQCMDLAEELYHGERPIVIYHPEIKEGIIGLVAGQYCEKYQCPVIVFTDVHGKPGFLKGSGRSPEGIHLKNILDSISEHIVGYGGHAGAAGMTIEAANLETFKKALVKATGSLPPIKEKHEYDLELQLRDALHMIDDLKAYEPFGEGNRPPMFMMDIEVSKKMSLMGDGSHGSIEGDAITFMFFGKVQKYKEMGSPRKMRVIGYLSESWFNGKQSFKFQVENFEKI